MGETVDFLVIGEAGRPWRELVRTVTCVRGSIRFHMECSPRFDYARAKHSTEVHGTNAVFRWESYELELIGTVSLNADGEGVATCQFELKEGEQASFVLRYGKREDGYQGGDLNLWCKEQREGTIAYWKAWAERCRYKGRWMEMVKRSALALKLMTFAPTGAIIAAPTCSLPEVEGGERNWDYRYVWIRDAAFTIFAFIRLGYTEEATAFMAFLHDRVKDDQTTGPIQVMYRIDGSPDLKEFDLDHLEGYRGSKPVRVGNAAADQLQLDIYGELIDSIYLYNKYAEPIGWDLWKNVRSMLYWLCDNWQKPDHSIWEIRNGAQQYTYSKMQCWVALDRGIRIARKRNLPLDFERVLKTTHRIYETVMEKGWSEKLNSFTQTFDNEECDATSLLFPLMLFAASRDPRMKSTVSRVQRELVSDSLVYRYKAGEADGLKGVEGTFSVCTFWLVEALAREGRVDEARLIFEKMLTYANHLGLYAEEVGPSGEALGNFPQAFTHLGLISAAFTLDRALDGAQ